MDMLDVKEFGAIGDGAADDTAALQRALDAAAEKKATVFVPAGEYLCADLKLHPQTGLFAHPTWRYNQPGGAILRLRDAGARCLLDIAGAVGSTVNGLCFDGGRLGKGIHGIAADKPDYTTEDALRLERCWIGRFTGDGLFVNHIWCFTVRHTMSAFNGGCGLRAEGWDGFLLDNWFSGNVGAGLGCTDGFSSMTMTGNRIEWNREGGIVLADSSHFNITGNYLDRSGRAGIDLRPGCRNLTITGNVIYRSGRPWRELEKHESCQVSLDGCENVVFSDNMLTLGRDDAGKGDWSPRCGLVYRGLQNCIIKDNVMQRGALEELLVNLGGHREGVIVKDNVGTVGAP